MAAKEIRPGEVRLDTDPGDRGDAEVTFIGRIRSPWSEGDSPRNIRQARERGGEARVELERDYWPGLRGLAVGQPVFLLYWMDRGRRDLILQSAAHFDGPRGVFSIRSPVRPNPIAMSAVVIREIDPDTGTLVVDAIDCFDGTPLIDIKPWLETVDVPPKP